MVSSQVVSIMAIMMTIPAMLFGIGAYILTSPNAKTTAIVTSRIYDICDIVFGEDLDMNAKLNCENMNVKYGDNIDICYNTNDPHLVSTSCAIGSSRFGIVCIAVASVMTVVDIILFAWVIRRDVVSTDVNVSTDVDLGIVPSSTTTIEVKCNAGELMLARGPNGHFVVVENCNT
jgi:hypothetical protein